MSTSPVSKGEQTRQAIILAAHDLFLQNGFHGASMRQIAQAAGLAVGSLYNHFSTKDDIFVAVLMARHPIHEILPALSAAQGDDVEAFIRDAARRAVASLQNRPDFLNLVFIELVEFKGCHLPGLAQTYFQQALAFTERLLEHNHQLRDIPLEMIVRTFIGLFLAYVVTGRMLNISPEALTQELPLDQFVDVFLYGILKEKSAAASAVQPPAQ